MEEKEDLFYFDILRLKKGNIEVVDLDTDEFYSPSSFKVILRELFLIEYKNYSNYYCSDLGLNF
jgi:hypothetical protein